MLLIPTFAALGACGGSSSPDPTSGVVLVEATSDVGAWTRSEALSLSAPATALGLDGDARAVVVFGGLAAVKDGAALAPRPLYAEADDIPSMGEPQVIRPRPEGGAWLGGEAGLFALDAHFVTRSPLSEATPHVVDVAEVGRGPLAGTWVLSSDALWWHAANGLTKVDIDLPGAAHLALDTYGDTLLVASERQLRLVQAAQGALTALDLDLETDAIAGLASGAGRLWVAAARGVFELDGAQWSLHDLGAASAVAADPTTGDGWARTEAGLVHVQRGRHTAYEASATERGLAVDRFGEVLTLDDDTVLVRGTDAADHEAVTFADVRPWLATHCSRCHRNQTADYEDYEVFAERAEEALARVRSGDMPRCSGSVRCAPEDAMSPSDYAVLDQWIRDGKPE